MQGYIDEIEYLKYSTDSEEIESSDSESKNQFLKVVKLKTFDLFFRLNTLKISVPIHYHILLIAIEAFQLLTLVLVDGDYSTGGPFESSSPWNLEQTQ